MSYIAFRNLCHFQPWGESARLSSGVLELYANLDTLTMGEFNDLGQRLNVCVAPKSGVRRCDAAVRADGMSFHEDQAWTTCGKAVNQGFMPWGNETIRR
jgi:hypothetical protein